MFGGKVLPGTVKLEDDFELLRERPDQERSRQHHQLWTYKAISAQSEVDAWKPGREAEFGHLLARG